MSITETKRAKTGVFARFWRGEEGIAAIVTTLMLPIILGMGGLAVDASAWFMEQRELQTAADAAALAAAYEISQGNTDAADAAARREAESNGLSASGEMELTISETDGNTTEIAVALSDETQLWFSQIFLDSVTVGASATSAVNQMNDGSACILSLDETEDQAIKTSGNVQIDMPDCGIAVNSDSDEGLYMNGSVDINVGDVRVHGDYDTVGGAVNFTYDSLQTGADRITDPYADLEVPSFTPCTAAQKRSARRINSNTTLSPGVFCGGITATGNNTITLQPGVYIIDGGNFNIAGQGSIVGHGVSIIMTNSASGGSYGVVDITGGRTVDLSAPEAGEDMEGVVFYQDRNAPMDGSNRILGTASVRIDGAAYFPAAQLTIGGNASAASDTNPCSRLIARTVTFHGNPSISNSCVDNAARNIAMPGTNAVRLVQ